MGPRHGGGDFLGETHAELVVACSLASMLVVHQPAFQQEKLLMVKIRLEGVQNIRTDKETCNELRNETNKETQK